MVSTSQFGGMLETYSLTASRSQFDGGSSGSGIKAASSTWPSPAIPQIAHMKQAEAAPHPYSKLLGGRRCSTLK
jgi:hypothetical protein